MIRTQYFKEPVQIEVLSNTIECLFILLVRCSDHTINSILKIIIEYVFLLIIYLERQYFKEPVQIDVLSNTSECLFILLVLYSNYIIN